jgi:hypothetical protein
MKSMSQFPRVVFVSVISAVLLVGCLTTKQVREIVATSNAELISPSLDLPGGNSTNGWKDPVAKIDQLILQNQDQPTLVNHLRVRQAMLLTVYQQDNLARERWKQVDASALKTERDKSLHQSRDALVWWYRRAPVTDPLDPTETGQGEAFVRQLSQTLNGVSDPNLAFYLGTIRAQMNLRMLNDTTVANVQATQTQVANALEEYVGLFTSDEKAWLKSGDPAELAEGDGIADFRRKVALAEMVKKYCKLPGDLQIASPEWKPEGLGLCT